MARKQLIKGANAARVEARISRVPADLGVEGGEVPSIFGAIKAMETEKRSAEVPRKKLAVKAVKPLEKATAKPSQARLSPSDFSAPEREAILRCCTSYRNQLPTYLLAVQKELKVLDSVIEKCRSASSRKNPRSA